MGITRNRWQNGTVELSERKNAPAVWRLRYTRNGQRKSMLIGTIDDFNTKEQARIAVAHLIPKINYTKVGVEFASQSATYSAPIHKHNCGTDQYERMYLNQHGGCAICGRREDRLVVDHCHKTGTIRELLCGKCNRALGLMDDSPHILRLAAYYLDKHRHHEKTEAESGEK